RACESDPPSNEACANLGRAFLEGRGVAKDETRALSLLERACDAKEASSCRSLAELAVSRRDETRAQALFARACEGGDTDACSKKDASGARPRRHPCAAAPASCKAPMVGWCDENEAPIGCCAAGLVAMGMDGICACPPGGSNNDEASCAKPTHEPEAQKRRFL